MTRREKKYPETSTFVFYNRNPKGKFTGDCLIRALSTALDIEYERVLFELAYLSSESGYSIGDNKTISEYMQYKGWRRCKQPRRKNGKKLTGDEFCKWLSKNYEQGEIGNVVCNIGGHHIVAIKPTNHGKGINCRYKVHDIWDSSDGCVGTVWCKEDLNDAIF